MRAARGKGCLPFTCFAQHFSHTCWLGDCWIAVSGLSVTRTPSRCCCYTWLSPSLSFSSPLVGGKLKINIGSSELGYGSQECVRICVTEFTLARVSAGVIVLPKTPQLVNPLPSARCNALVGNPRAYIAALTLHHGMSLRENHRDLRSLFCIQYLSKYHHDAFCTLHPPAYACLTQLLPTLIYSKSLSRCLFIHKR